MGVGYDVAALGQGVPPMTNYNIENLNFLFVDDNANMRHLMSTILSSLGAKDTTTVDSVDKGLGKLYDFDADIVIYDLRMEPLDGIEFIKMIRNNNTSPTVMFPSLCSPPIPSQAPSSRHGMPACMSSWLSRSRRQN